MSQTKLQIFLDSLFSSKSFNSIFETQLFETSLNSEISFHSETEIVQTKKSQLKYLIQNAKEQKLKLNKDRMEMIKFSKNLQIQESSLLAEEEQIQKERLAVQQQRSELNKLRAQLNHDQAKLKQLKQKLGYENDKVSHTLEELNAKAIELNRQRGEVKNGSPIGEKKVKRRDAWVEIDNVEMQMSIDRHRQERKEVEDKIRIEKTQDSIEIWLSPSCSPCFVSYS